jgi:hypothetical protein
MLCRRRSISAPDTNPSDESVTESHDARRLLSPRYVLGCGVCGGLGLHRCSGHARRGFRKPLRQDPSRNRRGGDVTGAPRVAATAADQTVDDENRSTWRDTRSHDMSGAGFAAKCDVDRDLFNAAPRCSTTTSSSRHSLRPGPRDGRIGVTSWAEGAALAAVIGDDAAGSSSRSASGRVLDHVADRRTL